MIVYGDRERRELPSRWFDRTRAELERLRRAAPSDHSAELAAVAIACGTFAQAALDAEFAQHGRDERTALSEACAALCASAGRAWLGRGIEPLFAALSRCETVCDERPLTFRDPEGYAFYALYPELYVRAARALPAGRVVQVIGIRSIGTSLAGFAAAALQTQRLPYSVRPTGHPFSRELAVGPWLEQTLLEQQERVDYVIVDEGPGLSGSSFLAVARWLLARGVDEPRITLLPSHAGEPGPQADAAAGELYRGLKRVVVPFEREFDESKIGSWFSDLTGPLSERTRDLAGGRWRDLHYPVGRALPPSHVRDERRKYLLQGERAWLMKFVGLGPQAREIVTRLRVLSDAGFVPALAGDRHGFILSQWRDDASPLPLVEGYDREAFIERLGRYLTLLTRRFPVDRDVAGASPTKLFELLRYNTTQLLGARSESLELYRDHIAALEGSFRPTATDNKLDAHEWLVTNQGDYLKCDAEAHWAGHDCIGAQDPAWDVAGARFELDLSEAERECLLRALHDRAGLRFSAEKLRFYELAYLAFRAGYAHYAELALRGTAEEDADGFAREQRRYQIELTRLLP